MYWTRTGMVFAEKNGNKKAIKRYLQQNSSVLKYDRMSFSHAQAWALLLKRSPILVRLYEKKEEIKMISKETKTEIIHMEMGVPGLKAAQVGVDAEIKALQDGVASIYPNINGTPDV